MPDSDLPPITPPPLTPEAEAAGHDPMLATHQTADIYVGVVNVDFGDDDAADS